MPHPAKQQIREHGRELLLVKPIILPFPHAHARTPSRTAARIAAAAAATSTTTSSLSPEEMVVRVTRSSVIASEPKLPVWMYLLFFAWCLFSAWIVVDVIAGSTFHDNDLALAALIILVASAIAASRLFLWIRDYRQRRRNVSLS